jgi:aspartyl-tRNA synthetase
MYGAGNGEESVGVDDLAACRLLGAVRTLVAAAVPKDVVPEAAVLSEGTLAGGGGIDAFLVVDFPMFEPYAHDPARPVPITATGLAAAHHPFTAPLPEDQPALEAALNHLAAGDATSARRELLRVRAAAYDLVANGWELAGGSVRIHDATLQERVLRDALALPDIMVDSFRHLLDSLAQGAPPHAGAAFGFDRTVALFAQAASLRDVIAFPKSAQGNDLLTGAPAPVLPEQLAEYHVRVADPKQ